MTKEKILRAIYLGILDENPDDSKLAPLALDIKLTQCYKKYLPNLDEDVAARNERELELTGILYSYIENAFYVGFDTALKFLMGGSVV